MIDWKEVRTALRFNVRKMEEHIPFYSYSEESKALRTDEKFSSLILNELRKSKKKLFDLLDTAYEMQRENLTKDLHSLRDDIDIFLDELKARRLRWDNELSTRTIKEVVKLDVEILNNTILLEKEIDLLRHALASAKKTRAGFLEKDMQNIERGKEITKKIARNLVVAFKQRDAILNLEKESDSMVIEHLKKQIERKY